MSGVACISHIFLAEETFWVAAGFYQAGSGDGLWIFLRFGKVDGDINVSIDTFRHPADVPADPVAADVIRILAEFVEIVCSFFRAFLVKGTKLGRYLGRGWCQAAHELGVKQIPVNNAVML